MRNQKAFFSKSRLLVSVIITPILHHAITASTSADDWPQWRGPNRDGISAETGWAATWPPDGPKQLWKVNVGQGYSSVAVAKGRLYTMGNRGDVDAVYCLDAVTGKTIWTHSYPAPLTPNLYAGGPNSTPTVDGPRVYTLSKQGHLFCLDAATGKVIWSKHLPQDFQGKKPEWGYSGSPVVEGDLLLVEAGAPGAALVALHKATGAVVWKAGSDKAGYGSPALLGQGSQRGVAVFHADVIVGRQLRDGKELWRHPWKTSYDVNAATPIIMGDKVFISSGYDTGCALVQVGSGPPKVLWQNKQMRNHINSCVLWQGHLYGFDESQLKCLDFASGAVRWTEKKFGKGSLLIADGKLIILGDKGLLAVAPATPAGYQELSSAQVVGGKDLWVVPVLANGKIYCRSKSDLVCLDVSGPK